MYELVYGYWTLPTTDDIDSNKLHPSRGMGGSIMIINGGVECGGSKAMAQAENRVKYYTGFLDYFNMTDRIDLADRLKGKNTCMEMQQFGPEHGVTYPNSWVGDWTGTCKLRSWDEGYSGFIDGHFKKCFEDKVLNK